jgi:hypothetical protein
VNFPRYKLDDPTAYGLKRGALPSELSSRTAALGNSVRVTSKLLGAIATVVDRASERLGIGDIECFVSSSTQVSAECFRDADGGTVIFLSSQLVDLLTTDELAFVIGHELTHSLLDHHAWHAAEYPRANDRSLDGLRAMEISADRGGAIACGDVEISIRAIAKTASGIRTIVDDMSILDYIRQERDARMSAGYAAVVARSTHPPLVTRAKALLRFATACDSDLTLGTLPAAAHTSLDADVARDMDLLFVDSEAFDERCQSAAFWIVLDETAGDARDFDGLLRPYGDDRVRAFHALAETMSRSELRAHVTGKADRWRAEIACSVAAMERRVNALRSEGE